MYQALYRKWRPLTFDDVVGQEHITETLKNQVKNDRLSHAYLFVGTRGTGKTTCAKILSRAVNCENPVDGNPCNKCRSCLGILDGSVMDVEEMDAASNNGVDNVRALRDEAVFSPASVKKRVYIIDEVHMLSTSAFNALLKILEEPPEHLMFILATTELHKVPATILSRCQRYSFRRIDNAAVAGRLRAIAEGERISLAPEAAEILARLSEGSMRDAVSLLDQCAGRDTITAEDVLTAMGLAGTSRTAELLDKISAGDTEAALSCFESLWMDGKEPATLLDELATLYRDIMMMKIAPKSGAELVSGGYDPKLLNSLGDRMTNPALLAGLGTVQRAQRDIRESLNPRVTAEMCIVTLCTPELSNGVEALEERVAALERGAASVPAPRPGNGFIPPRPHRSDPEPVREQPPVQWEKAPEPPAPVHVPEAKPEQAPAAEASEAPQPTAPAGDMAPDFWPRMLTELKKVLQIGAYNIISDPFHAEGAAEDGGLCVYVKNSFAMNMLNTPAVQDRLRAVASKVAGGTVPIRIVEGNPPARDAASGNDKIDKLMQFGNVKFE
ncbi:MAG: DNA polymerase III subunit gamma/tau [Candidatus Heteroscillospira sp.]|jgi:DNA polymerase-3 subunit gamma/tau